MKTALYYALNAVVGPDPVGLDAWARHEAGKIRLALCKPLQKKAGTDDPMRRERRTPEMMAAALIVPAAFGDAAAARGGTRKFRYAFSKICLSVRKIHGLRPWFIGRTRHLRYLPRGMQTSCVLISPSRDSSKDCKYRRIGVWRFTPLFSLLGGGHHADVPLVLPSPRSRPGLQFYKMQGISRILLLSYKQLLSSARARNISLHGNVCSTAADVGSNIYCTFAAGASS